MSGHNLEIDPYTVLTPEAFKARYNAHGSMLFLESTSLINKRFKIIDEDGNRYKFSRTKDGPKLIKDYSKHLTKSALEERINILEAQLKQFDFLAERIDGLESRLLICCKGNESKDIFGAGYVQNKVKGRAKEAGGVQEVKTTGSLSTRGQSPEASNGAQEGLVAGVSAGDAGGGEETEDSAGRGRGSPDSGDRQSSHSAPKCLRKSVYHKV